MKAMRTLLLTLAASAALGGVAKSQDQTAHTYQKAVAGLGNLWMSPITRLQQDLGITVGERMKLSGLLVNAFVAPQPLETPSAFKVEGNGNALPNPPHDNMPPPSFNDATARKPYLAVLRLSW